MKRTKNTSNVKQTANSKARVVNSGTSKHKSVGRANRKKRRKLTDSVIASIAMERFKGLTESGSLTPIEAVAEKFDRDSAVISRAVAKAFQDKLVAIVRKDKTEVRKRLTDLEDALLAKFLKLNKAIVIENLSGDGDESNALGAPLKHPLQQKLGLAMARFLATDSALRNGDVIGVGSGRGVELTLHSLEWCPQLRMQGVTLMSLTGSVYSRPNRKKGLWLDADRHVIEFAKYFNNEPKQYLICHPLAHEQDDLIKARQRTWLGDPKAPRPTLALLGVGRVAEEHRFYVEAEAEQEEDQEPFLQPINTLLVTLKDLCKEAVETGQMIDKKGVRHQLVKAFRDYSPAAEMSNFFFFVAPPPESSIPNAERVKQCITEINKKLLNIQEEHLMSMQLMVVAGAKRKSHALRALLTSDYNVTYLCTDADAATELINGTA